MGEGDSSLSVGVGDTDVGGSVGVKDGVGFAGGVLGSGVGVGNRVAVRSGDGVRVTGSGTEGGPCGTTVPVATGRLPS